MTDAQSNRLDMFNLVSEFYSANQAVIDTVNARTAAFTAHNANRDAIQLNLSAQTSNTRGAAADKSGARVQLSIIAETVFLPVRAWATVNADQTTRAEFDYSRSEIQQIKDDTIEAFLNHRITIVNDNLAALADYGITATLVTQLQDALTDYLAFLSAPRGAIVRRSVSTANLKALFKTASDHLRNVVDPLMVTLRASHPDLYKEYTSSRIIIDRKGPGNGDSDNGNDTPATGVRIAGTVFSQAGPMPLPDAIVRIYDMATGPGPDTKQTTTDMVGAYVVVINDLSKAITIAIEASATGYATTTINLPIEPGKDYEGQNIQLSPSAPPPPMPPAP